MTEVQEYEAWLKELKESRNIYFSQESMAKKLGITQESLSRILSGKRSGKRLFFKMRKLNVK